MKTKPCQACNGTGIEIDQRKLSKELRDERVKAGILQKDMAKALNISPQFLVDLEQARRDWTTDRIAAYKAVLNQATHKPK